MELEERILPLTIRRTLPSGEFVDISLKMLTQTTKPTPRRKKKAPSKKQKAPSKKKKAPRRGKKT